MDAVAVMAPGRFRRRLSDDHSDVAEPLTATPASSGSSGTGGGDSSLSSRSWLGSHIDGTASTRGRLPWLSPRERRHPLRDVRLSCFRSYLPGSGVTPSDGDPAIATPVASPQTPRTPRTPGSSSRDKDIKDREDEREKKSRGLSLSVRRTAGRSRGSKASENVYYISPPRQEQDQQQSPQAAAASKHSSGSGNLSARLRALSARCLALVHSNKNTAVSAGKRSARPCKQRSFSSGALPGLHDFQRRQLNPLYRDEEGDDDDHHHQDHQDQPDEEGTALSPSPSSNGVLGGDEDGDSGILVSEATSTPLSSLPGGRGSLPWGGAVGALNAATAASRALRSASLDRELLGGSPHLDEDGDEHDAGPAATSQARRSRASIKSSSSSSEISEIFSRFQRRRVAGTSTTSSSCSRPSSPPLLPAPPQRVPADTKEGSAAAGARRREFHLVRLNRASPAEELGIFIAKSDAPDRGARGYVVAHVVPGGLAHRLPDGQLRLGDELVVVNGRQLRGLSMAAARQRLRAGPTQVDIVIARPAAPQQCQCRAGSEGRDSGLDTSGSGDSMTEARGGAAICCCKAAPTQTPSPARRTLQESSVDYENVVLRPRDPNAPGAPAHQSSSPEMEPSSACSADRQRRSSPSPSRSRPATAGVGSSLLVPVSPSSPRSPGTSPSPSPMPGRQQLFQKHTAPASAKAARRSLALVSRSGSPPTESPEPAAPAETQHHSLKRRGRRHGGGRHGLDGAGSSGPHHSGSSEFRVELRKGPGCGALGFTVVGGADSPRGALPIFVRSVLEGGQAAQDGRLQPGDELLHLNGQPLRGTTHSEAVAMFRAVRAGPVVLTVCRRTAKKAQSCSDLVAGGRSLCQQEDD